MWKSVHNFWDIWYFVILSAQVFSKWNEGTNSIAEDSRDCNVAICTIRPILVLASNVIYIKLCKVEWRRHAHFIQNNYHFNMAYDQNYFLCVNLCDKWYVALSVKLKCCDTLNVSLPSSNGRLVLHFVSQSSCFLFLLRRLATSFFLNNVFRTFDL